MTERLIVAAHFLHARLRLSFRERSQLLRWQQRRLAHFLRWRLPQAAFYRGFSGQPLHALPIVDKAAVMAHFDAMNTRGITLEQAMALALHAEASRDFTPTLGDVTVGLSSGTSGNRGLFMATAAERRLWAGTLLARVLPSAMLRQLLTPWQAPLSIAFFLRANSNVYTTLGGGRIQFRFYDLLAGLEAALPALQQQDADILVAPANVLAWLARRVSEGRLQLRPRHIISVAEVLEPDDEQRVREAFGLPVHQIYQATEGFLGFSCEQGGLHLNESCVHIEPEWLDAERTRFQPIITDFTRQTQMVVRYRLNDVLRLAPAPCPCGRAELTLAAIEGRCDDVLYLPRRVDGAMQAIFPDFLRRAMLLAGTVVEDFRLQQRGTMLHIELNSSAPALAQQQVEQQLQALWQQQGVLAPALHFLPWQTLASTSKRRRIRGDGNLQAESTP